MGFFEKFFGSQEGQIKKLQPLVDAVNDLEPTMQKLRDEEIIAKTEEFKKRIAAGETEDDLLPEAFALVREASLRVSGERHYDVQIIGGIVLHQGKIAEMKTGEGKTLTSTLAVYLNALSGKGVHVVTVNDYLAKRDCNWMGAIYDKLGMTTACITHEGGFLYEAKSIDRDEVDIEEENLIATGKKEAYDADITYGTNNEFGFDYLRDNMARTKEEMVQRPLHYAIVDEVDSILIDEARTPLIISAPDEESGKLYKQFASIVPQLKEDKDFTVDVKDKTVALTDEGISKIEQILGIGNIYEEGKVQYVHHLEQSLKAHILFERDKDYMIKDGQVVIVDEFTGRAMEGRRYSDGLHQALEAKENVPIQKESRTLATITFQNYFRMYEKIAGMTGTASTSAEEFQKVYGLDVIEIPTHKDIIRKDLPDVIYKDERIKFNAIAQKIAELHKKGQPVLVGTVAIEKSEALSRILEKKRIPHSVLNAKFHEKEAEIIANAGRRGAVTIATNMAGRGTDIKLGEGVNDLGGLYIIGTERHEARRIDNQLRGRSGRQGDRGTTQFYIALDDELMRRFGGDRMQNMMGKFMDDEPIQNKLISKQIEGAQNKIEGFNFDIRKHVLDYDDVINKQREVIYKRRREILEKDDLSQQMSELLREEIEAIVARHAIAGEYAWDTNALVEDMAQLMPLPEGTDKKLASLIADPKHDERETVNATIDFFYGLAKQAYHNKEQQLSPEAMRGIEKAVMLQVVDQNWMNHIDMIDQLRRGIGLRGYGQRDPLIEFKKEAFELFTQLVARIREDILRTIFHIEQEPVAMPMTTMPEELSMSGAESNPKQFGAVREQEQAQAGDSAIQNMPQPAKSNKTVGRNELCPCGSGKKYKKCHGKNV